MSSKSASIFGPGYTATIRRRPPESAKKTLISISKFEIFKKMMSSKSASIFGPG